MGRAFTKYFYYPLLQKFKGHRVAAFLEESKKRERLSEKQLYELQREKLKIHLSNASRTPFYSRLFARIDFDARSDIDNFPLLPVSKKIDIRQSAVDFHNPEFTGKTVYGKTSGSTGISLSLRYDSEWEQRNQAIQLRGRSWWGIEVGSRELVIWGRPFGSKRAERLVDFKMALLNRKQINSFEVNDRRLEELMPGLIRFNPEVIYAYSTGAGRLAEYILEHFPGEKPLRPKAVIVTSEMLLQPQAEAIKQAFGLTAANEYGSAEAGIMCFQCREGGWHISADNLILEIDHPDENGEGKVVVTPLMNYAMPLVRYEIGDVGKLVQEKCACGRTLPLFQLSQGRVEEVIVTPKGKTACTAFFAYIGKSLTPLGLRQFRAVQKSPTLLHMQLVHAKKGDAASEALIRAQVRKYLGEEMTVAIEYLEEIQPDASGKLRYFIKEDF